jgi:hypothetical protein
VLVTVGFSRYVQVAVFILRQLVVFSFFHNGIFLIQLYSPKKHAFYKQEAAAVTAEYNLLQYCRAITPCSGSCMN